MGEGNAIGPYSVIADGTRLGNHNWIGPHVVVGSPPQHRTVSHRHEWIEPSGAVDWGVEIGSHCVIREFTAVQSGTKSVTQIGSGCFIMDKVHIAHDCAIGDHVTVAPGVVFGGHTRIGTGTNVGINASTHQFVSIGPGAMIGMGAVVLEDVECLAVVAGVPAKLRSVNRVGMQRLGFTSGDIARMSEALQNRESPDAAVAIAEIADEYLRRTLANEAFGA